MLGHLQRDLSLPRHHHRPGERARDDKVYCVHSDPAGRETARGSG